jgi:hypothetical protein
VLTLLHALQDETADHWRVVAQAWGVEYPASARDPVAELIGAILNPERVAAAYRALAPGALDAVDALRRSGGKIAVAEFFHRFGEIRSMGQARLRREEPWRSPISVSEELWYSGWIGRAFIRSGGTAQEYIFLPGDLEALIPAGAPVPDGGWNLLSYFPDRHEAVLQAGFRAAEDAGTLLAFIRNWPPSAHRPWRSWIPAKPLTLHLKDPSSVPLILQLLREKGLLRGNPLQPDPDSARAFLERPPEAAGVFLLQAWRDSASWNDLERMGRFSVDGGWPNDPLRARSAFLEALRIAPRGEWCTIASAVELIRRTRLEFLRPASAFEAWQLRDEAGEYLGGIESWERVEGALVRYYFTGPLAALGAVDLAPRADPKAFRLTPSAGGLFDESETAPAAESRARIRPDGSIVVLPGTPFLQRYQLARCADWLPQKGGAYVYRISARSLERAREQGVRAAHILPLLDALGGGAPPGLARAIRRWERNGTEAAVRREQILLPRSAEAAEKIAALAERDRTALARIEGPVYLVGRPGSSRLRARLLEDNLLLEDDET